MMGAIVTIDESNGSKITISLIDESLLMEVSGRDNRKLAIDLVDGSTLFIDLSNSFTSPVGQGRKGRQQLLLAAHNCVSSANGP
jgi:hypothetical protein